MNIHLTMMFYFLLILLVTFCLCTNVASEETLHAVLQRRETSEYAPSIIQCPQILPKLLSAEFLSDNETKWLSNRRNNTIWALREFLIRSNISGFDVGNYLDRTSGNATNLPNIAIAVSGGGYRALMIGAGALAAFDNRTTNSTALGQLGGLLQASTYLTALSGGSWLVGSLYMHNFPPVQEIVTGPASGLGSLWQFDQSILTGPDGLSINQYYDTIFNDISEKEQVGSNVSLTDYWGRALSFQLFNSSTGSPGFTFSSISSGEQFSTSMTPMPIIVADERAPSELLIPSNATVLEFNPWEFGTYDPNIYAYCPLKYVGSQFIGGSVPSGGTCSVGLDNIGFVVGTSSSLFNQFYLQINSTNANQRVKDAVSNILRKWGEGNNDISLWPNPFFGFKNGTNSNSQNKTLTLVDGGEDLQNIPFHPLLRSIRHVDIIFAVDASADTSSRWPNGTAMVSTYNRTQKHTDDNSTSFPAVPDQNTFINLGLNRRPTFFGCNETDMTKPSPLIVYLPNSPYTYYSNVSTFELSFNDSERNSIIRNGYNMATQANSSLDDQWPACVGCAILARSFHRVGAVIPDTCTQCYSRYCWNGTYNSTIPNNYYPTQSVVKSGGAGLNPSYVSCGIAVFLAVASQFAV